MRRRRRVDWPLILGLPELIARAQGGGAERPGQLAALLSAFDEILALEDPDAILRRAVELARERIGLARAAIFLLDRARNLMLGTWGSDLNGALVDEHQIMYASARPTGKRSVAPRKKAPTSRCSTTARSSSTAGARRASRAGAGCACTPIRIRARDHRHVVQRRRGCPASPSTRPSRRTPRFCVRCSATILDPVRGVPGAGAAATDERSMRRLVTDRRRDARRGPALGGGDRAPARRQPGWFARVFKAEMGMSLVEYRNRLRLDRFDVLLDTRRQTLLEAARAAGFGSYAQFHRVFRELRGVTPREYLRRR